MSPPWLAQATNTRLRDAIRARFVLDEFSKRDDTARDLGVSPHTLRAWLAQEPKVNTDALRHAAETLGVPASALMGAPVNGTPILRGNAGKGREAFGPLNLSPVDIATLHAMAGPRSISAERFAEEMLGNLAMHYRQAQREAAR